jgi:glycosyltransferase involved in cell wall biosynthesis
MKILFIDFTLPYLLKDSSYPVGGWAVELHAWINGLCANGHQVGVLTWKGANAFVNKKLDFHLIETYDPDKGIKILKYFYYYIPEHYKKTKECTPDVIIQACAGIETGIMGFIANKLSVPFVYRVANDMDTDQRYRTRLLKYEQIAYNYGLKKTDVILCQNSYQYDNLKIKFPKKPLRIIHNPFLKTYDTNVSSFKERRYVAWLGIFQKQKNLPLLYEIAKQIPESNFKIAGMPGKNIDSDTHNALKKLKKLSNIEFVGYLSRKQVPSFLSNAIALLNTSHYEGFSNTYLEAFSVGTPVIAPLNADPDHVIEKNRLGFAVKNNSDFPVVIQSVFENKERFIGISKQCQEYVYKNHDPNILAKRLVEIISKI